MTCIKWAAAPHGRSEADIVLCLLFDANTEIAGIGRLFAQVC